MMRKTIAGLTLLLVSSCSGQVATSDSSSSSVAASTAIVDITPVATTTATIAVGTTPSASSDSAKTTNPLTPICQAHCAALAEVGALGGCTAEQPCLDQAAAAEAAVTAFTRALVASGILISDYPDLKTAYVAYVGAKDTWDRVSPCKGVTSSDSPGWFQCGMQEINLVTTAGKIGSVLAVLSSLAPA